MRRPLVCIVQGALVCCTQMQPSRVERGERGAHLAAVLADGLRDSAGGVVEGEEREDARHHGPRGCTAVPDGLHVAHHRILQPACLAPIRLGLDTNPLPSSNQPVVLRVFIPC